MQVAMNNENFNYCVIPTPPTTYDDIMHYRVAVSRQWIMLATDTNTFVRVDGIYSTPTTNSDITNVISRDKPSDGVVWLRLMSQAGSSFPAIRIAWKIGLPATTIKYKTFLYNGAMWITTGETEKTIAADTEFDAHTWICGTYCNNTPGTQRVTMGCHIILSEHYYIQFTITEDTSASPNYYVVNFNAKYSTASIRTKTLPQMAGTNNELIQLIYNSGSTAGSKLLDLKNTINTIDDRVDNVEEKAQHAEDTANRVASITSSLFVSR